MAKERQIGIHIVTLIEDRGVKYEILHIGFAGVRRIIFLDLSGELELENSARQSLLEDETLGLPMDKPEVERSLP